MSTETTRTQDATVDAGTGLARGIGGLRKPDRGVPGSRTERTSDTRIPAIDWMRGLVMILMATDHASEAFNATRPVTDSVLWYDPAQPLDALAFAYRWLSHLCAPTFLFLAGSSLALSISKKKQRGASAWSIDRDLLIRGLIILSIDLTIIQYFWLPNVLLLQVMYAISLSMILMIPARRLPAAIVGGLGVAVLVGCEFLVPTEMVVRHEAISILRGLWLSGGWIDLPDDWGISFGEGGSMHGLVVAYPMLPWWAMMALGWAFGAYLLKARSRNDGGTGWTQGPVRVVTVAGVVMLLVFVALRGLNGWGNLGLLRQDTSWVQWLHVSKYPPSLTFTALELGIMCLILSGMLAWQAWRFGRASMWNPFLVFGQTAFFFYVAHIVMLELASHGLGMYQSGGLRESVIATVVSLIVLYPMCLWYRRIKTRYLGSPLRYF